MSEVIPDKPSDLAVPASAAWHAMRPEQVLSVQRTPPEGLPADDARERLLHYGRNSLPPQQQRSAWRRFLAQFENFLLQILLGAVVIMVAIGHYTDAGVVLAVVLINALMGFTQEGKAEQAIRAIQQMLSPQATVLRGGARLTVPAETVVPGDLVLLESGDRVPADLRLVRVKNLQIDEAALTGESVPVAKQTDPVDDVASLGDRSSMAFSGTLVTYGQASGVVVATGVETEIGRISSLLAKVEPLETPLLRHMTSFARTLTFAILTVAAAIFVFGVLVRGQPPAELFLAVVTLAVAAIPEALPAVLTIAMAIGVQRMAKRRALIRRLPAVETLGSVSVICSDKTGTLTRNEMTVGMLATADYGLEVGGAGYAPHGGFSLAGREFLPESNPNVMDTIRAAALCNDAGLRQVDGAWVVDGDPMEGALLTLAHKAGIDPDRARKEFPRLDVIPFESEHRFMATLHLDHSGHAFICVKGAPERILQMCRFERTTDGDRTLDPAAWLERINGMASKGQRILGAAIKAVLPEHRELRVDDVDNGLTMLGLYGIIDPPREEAVAAVAECRAAGIRVKMITGDHAATARAIAGKLGFDNTFEALTGPEIESLTDEELSERIIEVDVFARASPEHKLRLVQALQARGAVVAMTGDGVNDAPALKRADVGVAMGIKGTEAAKEAAQVVLADDNFASIAHAVREGRTVYDNLTRTLAVNTLVVMELFYLFSVRFLRTPSLTLYGVFGTPVVLAAVAAVVVLQLFFTYAPFMERFFETRPIRFAEGWPVIMAGVLLFIILEIEKAIRYRWEREAVTATPGRAPGTGDLA